MNINYPLYPDSVRKDLELRQFYVKLSNLVVDDNFILVLLDENEKIIKEIPLENAMSFYGQGIVVPKRVDDMLSVWFNVISIELRVAFIRLKISNKKDSNNILVSIYNKTSLKLIYNFNYVGFYMNGEVVKLKRVNDFYVLEE